MPASGWNSQCPRARGVYPINDPLAGICDCGAMIGAGAGAHRLLGGPDVVGGLGAPRGPSRDTGCAVSHIVVEPPTSKSLGHGPLFLIPHLGGCIHLHVAQLVGWAVSELAILRGLYRLPAHSSCSTRACQRHRSCSGAPKPSCPCSARLLPGRGAAGSVWRDAGGMKACSYNCRTICGCGLSG